MRPGMIRNRFGTVKTGFRGLPALIATVVA
jgi:hypothetical protein